MPQLKIIAKYRNGQTVKGTTQNFWPNKDRFDVIPLGAPAGSPLISVPVSELKAVFVVHSLEGNPTHVKQEHFQSTDKVIGHKLAITFTDGEVLECSSVEYDLNKPGFFVYPADRGGNNDRIFVVASSVRAIKRL